jgi:cytochrome c2
VIGRLLATLALTIALAAPASSAFAQAPEGRRALQRYGCASCHQVPGVRASRQANCVACHQEVVARPQSGLGRAPHVEHYLHAPDLRRITRRLREDYLLSFVRDPHDVRPRLEETMPRLPVSDADAQLIVAYLRESAGPVTVPSSPAPSRANVARGRQVFDRSGCATCHEVGNLDFGIHIPPEALMGMGRPAYEAPNLRFARDRLHPDVALQWILNPRAIDPETQMPHPELSREDAIAVRDFVFLTELGSPVAPPRGASFADLNVPSRRVRFAEVRRIFQRSCIHCHAHTNGQETSGVFGFAPSQLDLSSVEGVRAGTALADGTRRSVIAPDASGVPPLVARLLRRHAESARDLTTPRHDPLFAVSREHPTEAVGMPLGLPPVPASDIATIAAWIAQGARD